MDTIFFHRRRRRLGGRESDVLFTVTFRCRFISRPRPSLSAAQQHNVSHGQYYSAPYNKPAERPRWASHERRLKSGRLTYYIPQTCEHDSAITRVVYLWSLPMKCVRTDRTTTCCRDISRPGVVSELWHRSTSLYSAPKSPWYSWRVVGPTAYDIMEVNKFLSRTSHLRADIKKIVHPTAITTATVVSNNDDRKKMQCPPTRSSTS